jgi:cell division protein FtsN
MKRNAAFFYILIVTAVLGNAQTIDHSRYREITLPQFEEWKQGVPRGGTEPELFKARVLFEELSETAISFADPGEQTSIYFTVDKTWPEMETGQPVTIYFTAQGSWSWNRVLDEIDHASALAWNPPPVDPAAADPSYDQYDAYDQYDQYNQEQYDQEQYDQTGYDGEEDLSPRQPSASAPSAVPVSGSPAPSMKITGASPRPGRVYRLQVGAFTVERNAARTLNRLKDAGFSPRYERHGRYLRVVLSGVRAADVRAYAERITGAGFSEIWCREER